MKISRPLSALALIATTFTPGLCTAADLHVPSFYPTIQMAINAAAAGDTIYLEPGTYYENINFSGKNITIRRFNKNFESRIDGGQAGPVVTFTGQEGPGCSLREVTIFNGKAATGGGIQGNNTQATIRDCLIGGNSATGNGGAISGVSGTIRKCQIIYNQSVNGGAIADSDGTIEDCTISNNRASANGGGIYNCAGIIQNSRFVNNEAGNAGGAIYGGDGLVRHNTIDGNRVTAAGPVATPASFGGGISHSDGHIYANTITNNTSNGDGGGVSHSNGLIQNNIIARNTARRGGGMAASAAYIQNNTIWGNSGTSTAGGCFNLGTSVTNCIVYANTAPSDAQWSGVNVPQFSCVQNWTGGQPFVINADPLLKDPNNGNFQLLAGSPCIDAGQLVAGLYHDFEGDARPFLAGPLGGDLSGFDMGADEFVPLNIDVAAAWNYVTTKYSGKPGKMKGQLQGSLYVANVGTEPINGTFYAQMFISWDPFLDGGDLAVGNLVKVKKMKPGTGKSYKYKLKLPLNVPVTGLYIIAVADPAHTLGEGNTANNISVFGPLN